MYKIRTNIDVFFFIEKYQLKVIFQNVQQNFIIAHFLLILSTIFRISFFQQFHQKDDYYDN